MNLGQDFVVVFTLFIIHGCSVHLTPSNFKGFKIVMACQCQLFVNIKSASEFNFVFFLNYVWIRILQVLC